MAEIRWFGHNCFRIRAREAIVLMDPVGKKTGYSPSKQTADIVTVSHKDPESSNLQMVKPEYALIDGPGEYELHAIFISGMRSYHDNVKGAERGYNTVFEVDIDGLRIVHLGDLGHPLNDDAVEALSNIDILFAPAGGGGGTTLSAAEVAEAVGNISPKMVIPMQYRTAMGDKDHEEVEAFCKHLGIEMPQPVEKLTVKPSDLSDQMQLVLLQPES
jgi:L-ascorbate metabolism protein UlaG (beta-lactamase superfamily)